MGLRVRIRPKWHEWLLLVGVIGGLFAFAGLIIYLSVR